MKIIIEFECDNAAFEGWLFQREVLRILLDAHRKIGEQLSRKEGCVCTALESADKLLDSNGNTVGSVKVGD
jgi:hypothetical protein